MTEIVNNTRVRKYYKTIVVSDIHLGSKYSKVNEVIDFLKSVDTDVLILNGDIIDGWQLSKPARTWQPEYTKLFKIIMKMMENRGTKVIYISGNHDDFLSHLTDIKIANILISKDYILESGNLKYFVTHGDIFDHITSNMRWVAKLGDVSYNILLRINHLYNLYRRKRGKPYYPLSQYIKNKIKIAVSNSSGMEDMLTDLAKAKKCQGVICGHIHRVEDRMIRGIHYLNSGDWVETMSALLEDEDNNWTIYRHKDGF